MLTPFLALKNKVKVTPKIILQIIEHMKNSLFTLFLLVLTSFLLNAQQIEWVQTLGDIRYDQGLDIHVDEVGNSYLTGAIQNETIFGGDTSITINVLLGKYDANGNKTWQQSLDGSDNEVGNSISVDGAGIAI